MHTWEVLKPQFKKLSQQMIHKFEDKTWSDYAAAGYTTNKILVDIKLLD